MRIPALILLLTLAGPPVAAVVCNLDCIEHQSAVNAMAASCHRHADSGHAKLTNAGPSVCHDEDIRVAAVVPLTVPLTTTPAIVRSAAAPLSYSTPTALTAAHRYTPPDLHSTTTPLRI